MCCSHLPPGGWPANHAAADPGPTETGGRPACPHPSRSNATPPEVGPRPLQAPAKSDTSRLQAHTSPPPPGGRAREHPARSQATRDRGGKRTRAKMATDTHTHTVSRSLSYAQARAHASMHARMKTRMHSSAHARMHAHVHMRPPPSHTLCRGHTHTTEYSIRELRNAGTACKREKKVLCPPRQSRGGEYLP